MVHTCRNCKRTFDTELGLELHKDTCSDAQLFCRKCGTRFAERRATRDGWHYDCPTDDCDGEGIGEDLLRVRDALTVAR
ncbi:HVO_2901 family zinc finger protein [Halomarina halobia]|uniref:HVO_2901 family zinc finger protein n=1 Tax=Halomarina halobia TaxID=3033386 RepID=A0ABD6A6E4_9EURY|nr:HVO_2901 family zinc finger protein [Halomarina sp. PSR21]